MYSSIDLALAKMERQVRRYKDRITSHKPHKGRAAKVRQAVLEMQHFEMAEEVMRHATEEAAEEAEAAEPRRAPAAREIQSKEFKAERLSVDQAVMQMDLMHRAFLVFTNVETGDINVVYRLEDGNVGLLETRGHVDED
jgi:putative sigma-54 modulation protein